MIDASLRTGGLPDMSKLIAFYNRGAKPIVEQLETVKSSHQKFAEPEGFTFPRLSDTIRQLGQPQVVTRGLARNLEKKLSPASGLVPKTTTAPAPKEPTTATKATQTSTPGSPVNSLSPKLPDYPLFTAPFNFSLSPEVQTAGTQRNAVPVSPLNLTSANAATSPTALANFRLSPEVQAAHMQRLNLFRELNQEVDNLTVSEAAHK